MISVDNVVSLIDDVSGDVAVDSVRQGIIDLEGKIREELVPAEMPIRQMCSGGIYARELFIPKGTVLTGRMYLIDHIDFMVFGDMTVTSDDGSKRISGYNILPGKAGKKRAGYAHEDTLWVTFCTTEEYTEAYYLEHIAIEDSDKYEQALIKRRIVDETLIKRAFESQTSYRQSEYKSFKNGYLVACDKITKDEADRLDFSLMAKEIGISEEQIQSETLNDDRLSPLSCKGVFTKESPINKMGLYTSNQYQSGDVIMRAGVDGVRTIAGRYTNHSINPNAIFMRDGNDLNLVAISNMNNEEITIDYRESFKLRQV